MSAMRSAVLRALVATALLSFAYFGTMIAVGSLFRRLGDSPGLGPARTLAQLGAWLAALGLFVAAARLTVPLALRPAPLARTIANVLPAYLVGLGLVGAVLGFARIGTVGDMLEMPGVGGLTFAASWIAIAGILGTIAVVIAIARGAVSSDHLPSAMGALKLGAVPGVILWLAVGAILLIVLTTEPAATAGAAGVPGGAVPPGGSQIPGDLVAKLGIGYVLMTVFLAILLLAVPRPGQRGAAEERIGAPDAAPSAGSDDEPGGLGRPLLAAGLITVVAFMASQALRLPRDNPPPQVGLQWDSETTQELASAACMDCHSNETVWPWYSAIAPSSWLTAGHVRSGRRSFNLSELNQLPTERLGRLPDRLENAITMGRMPPADYMLMHSGARLSDAEKDQLIEGFKASFAGTQVVAAPAP